MHGNTEEQTTSPSLFFYAIGRIAVSQICQSIGLTGSQSSALEALTNIATRYLQALARSASRNANSCGRTECNHFDVIRAIEDMSSVQGFPGASNVNQLPLNSGALREIMKFVKSVDEIPFAKPIPRRIHLKRRDFPRCSINFKKDFGRNRPFAHVPSWLPSFPDPSTSKNVRGRVHEVDRSNNCVQEQDGNFCQETDQIASDKSRNWEGKRNLPIERERVRFKLGLGQKLGLDSAVEIGLRNGICRGGKRISLHNRADKDEKRFNIKRQR